MSCSHPNLRTNFEENLAQPCDKLLYKSDAVVNLVMGTFMRGVFTLERSNRGEVRGHDPPGNVLNFAHSEGTFEQNIKVLNNIF